MHFCKIKFLSSKLINDRLVSGCCDILVKTWKEVDNVWVEESKFDLHSDWVRDYPDSVIEGRI